MVVKRTRSRKKWLIVLLVILVIAAVIAVLEFTNTTHIFHKAAVVRAPSAPITKLPAKAKTSTNNTNKTPTANNGVQQGTATDKNGQVPGNVPTDPSKWSTSASKVITVKLPGSNDTIKSGATLTGTASISQVQYRLTDSSVGVISEGPVTVVGGNFTANISFTAHSSSGRLDVFSTESNGKEINEVQIPVNF